MKIDLLGVNSLYGDAIGRKLCDPSTLGEVRLRVAGRTTNKAEATKIVNESGGGGVTKSVSEVVSICSIFVPREDIKVEVMYEEV